MAKLYFYYSAMNAGKSTMLLQANYNYKERSMRTLIFIPSIGDREQNRQISSRIGLCTPAIAFGRDFDFLDYVEKNIKEEELPLQCVLVDEAQFLTRLQVKQLSDIVDFLKVPVLTYGLRTDFRGELFEGSHYLLAWAEEINEVKTMCHCGNKAIMTVRADTTGKKIEEGPQIQIGNNSTYISTCRLHHKKGYTRSIITPL